MTVDLIYPTHNRIEFVQESLAALRKHTNWELVNRIHILDDRSTDGTFEYLHEQLRDFPVAASFTSNRFGGPVAAMNHALDRTDQQLVAKIDSDLIVCPAWLEHLLATLNAHPHVDAIGMEPGFGGYVAPLDVARTVKPARWIGGIGLFRTKVFARNRPQQSDRFFGLTSHWRKFANTAWISPDLPVFLLDHLPMDPWRSLSREYVRRGWSRQWPEIYTVEMSDYWAWWLRSRIAVA